MSFNDKLSQREELALRPRLGNEEVEYCFSFDLNERESFIDGRLVITKERLFVLVDGEITEERRIDAGTEYKMRENGSSGLLEFTDVESGAVSPLMYFSLGGLKRFGYAESILNAFSEHKDITIYDKEAIYSNCPTCGTKFIHNTRTCPKCNNKVGLFKRLMLSTKDTWPLFALVLAIIMLNSVVVLTQPFIMRHLVDEVVQPMEAYTARQKLLDEGTIVYAGDGVFIYSETGLEFVSVAAHRTRLNLIERGDVILSDAGIYVYSDTGEPHLPAEEIIAPRTPGWQPIIFVVLLLGLASVVRALLGIARAFLSTLAGGRMSRGFRSMVYEKISGLSIKFLDTKQTGDLMNRVNNDTERIRGFLVQHTLPFLNEAFVMIVAMTAIMLFDWRLGLVVIAPMPLVALFMSRVNFRKRFHAQWVRMDKMNSTLNNILSGIRVVKAFGQEKREIERFCSDAAKVRDISTSNERFFFTLFPLIQFAIGFGNYFVLLYCGTRILNYEMTIGELVQFSAYAQMMYGRIGWFIHMPRQVSDAANAANRIFEVIDQEIEIKNDNLIEREIFGDIDVEDVTFGYMSYKPVIKHLNLKIKQGEMIGIVGHSGAGKSTFINLLMRLYDADEGSIILDGDNFQALDIRTYKNQIGVVLQEPFLFSGTVLDNIKYSKPEATFEEIITAAKIANAHDFITQLPNGYDTKVGEKGHSLSGGERQRVSIARAVLNDPKILILDEATASVDTETEQAIQEAFARLIKGRTTFAIAHRLSTLKNADRIMVMDKGELKEFGSHKELMEIEGGIYHGLVMAQRRMSKVKAIQV